MSDANTETKEDEQKTPADISSYWQVQLALADRDQGDWVKNSREIVNRYRAEKLASTRGDSSRRFNILFSNTEVLKSALYGKTAKPDVRRRFSDADPVGRQASEVIERSLVYCADSYDIDKSIGAGLHDYLLTGRGVIRIEYEPVISERPSIDPMTGQPAMGEDNEPAMERFIADQILKEKYVYWEDYRQCPARVWDDVLWVAFRHLMTKDDLEGLFEEKPQGAQVFTTYDKVPLNWTPDSDNKRKIPDDFKKAEVWEIWDRSKKERAWIVKGFDSPLRIDEDPYGLEDFFPLVEPLRSIEDTDSLVPTPEFNEYRDQADDLDEITARINRLTKALKRRGVYNKAIPELRRLARAGDNEFIAADNYAELSAKGGLKGQFETEDISLIAMVLKELYLQRGQLVQAIYEVTGIADIMRGASDPGETLGAQKLKAQFGSSRLKKRQRSVQKWVRDIYKLKAEIIAEHFEPDVLTEMTGIQVTPEIIQLLRSDKLRSYRIDIETDSTIFEDAAEQKQSTIEMLGAVSTFLEKAIPAVQQVPQLAPLAFEMLSIGVRAFKEGRKIEDVIEQTGKAITEAGQQPKPDPKAQELQGKMAMDQQKHQMEMQGKAADVQATQIKAAAEGQKAQMGLQTEAIKHHFALQRATMPGQQGPMQ